MWGEHASHSHTWHHTASAPPTARPRASLQLVVPRTTATLRGLLAPGPAPAWTDPDSLPRRLPEVGAPALPSQSRASQIHVSDEGTAASTGREPAGRAGTPHCSKAVARLSHSWHLSRHRGVTALSRRPAALSTAGDWLSQYQLDQSVAPGEIPVVTRHESPGPARSPPPATLSRAGPSAGDLGAPALSSGLGKGHLRDLLRDPHAEHSGQGGGGVSFTSPCALCRPSSLRKACTPRGCPSRFAAHPEAEGLTGEGAQDPTQR